MSRPPSPKQNATTKVPNDHQTSQPPSKSQNEPTANRNPPRTESSVPAFVFSQGGPFPGPSFQHVGSSYSSRPAPSYPLQPSFQHVVLSQAGDGSASFATSSSAQTQVSRKTKAHVASACVNCKKAHLSCDVSRPCARCVASGKQDTCFDVQHKKRGRPRLREEAEAHGERIIDHSNRLYPQAESSSQTGIIQPQRARPRSSMASSFRPIHSQSSEERSQWLSLPSGMVPSPTHHPRYPQTSYDSNCDIPTAFVDLDMGIMKANRSFEEVVLDGHRFEGRNLVDFVRMGDATTFAELKNRLRAERESRDPSFMPPIIVSTASDHLPDITDVEIGRCTASFQDHTYTWTTLRNEPKPFPARVRLAKLRIYFAVITLPTFASMQQHMRQAVPISSEAGPSVPADSPLTPVSSGSRSFLQRVMGPGQQETTPPTYHTTTRQILSPRATRPTSMPLSSSVAQIYGPSVPFSTQQQATSMGSTTFPSATSEAIHLPPILPRSDPTAPIPPRSMHAAGPSTSDASLVATTRTSRSASPPAKRRRRMSIGNVLQR